MMKNLKLKRLMAAGLAGVIAAGMIGCSGGGGDKKNQGGSEDPKMDVEISYWNSGLGTDWLDAMIEAFKDEHPEYHVYYKATADSDSATAAYGMEDIDTVDLYLCGMEYDHSKMEPLTDVLDAAAYGDSKTVREKFNNTYLKMATASDGVTYALTYGGGVLSIVYNKKMFEDAGILELPRTTDELVAVCDTLYSNNMVPLAHFNPIGYWDYISEAWFAQCDGIDYYLNNFYACTDENGNSPSKEVFTKKDGRYETIKVLEKIVTPDYTMAGSNSSDHVSVQTQFLNGSSAMMADGSWLGNEMKSTGQVDNFGMMRLPVISAITKRLETVKSDSLLRVLISAIDSVTDGEKQLADYQSGDGYVVDGTQISAADWEAVADARNTCAINYSGENAYIPNYSENKAGAKEFLKFLYSDKGSKVYADKLHMTLPMTLSQGELDTTAWNGFELDQLNQLKTAVNYACFYNAGKHEIFIGGGASAFVGGLDSLRLMCSKNAADRVGSEEVWKSMVQKVEDNYEMSWLANIK